MHLSHQMLVAIERRLDAILQSNLTRPALSYTLNVTKTKDVTRTKGSPVPEAIKVKIEIRDDYDLYCLYNQCLYSIRSVYPTPAQAKYNPTGIFSILSDDSVLFSMIEEFSASNQGMVPMIRTYFKKKSKWILVYKAV